ncbi:type II toxin-antitoxin system death-on-curing family toxin [Salipaludibacillus sp. CUR1]|uniref:type II toxin-antitoxin system death-on-curing family toxin n=1 Tax=Salipaludibacillus sp. CUR1 TaxID=2820003 RepID=UPI001E3D7A54|nr:type II toxin-antitoxin system death-on-curing family toxin [Salipaludibacillus sp. CUR1]MCE7791701.1 type II toxin-antitoxin system death-on-curing family toxin [Salipaludibacillus sp. CUR1]
MEYISYKDAVLVHYLMMKRYGEGEHAGVKNEGLLESALHRPKQTVFGEDAYKTLWEKAAVLFHSISRNHAFHNGNKRTALAVTEIFLKKNGYKFNHEYNQEIEDFTVDVARGDLDVDDIAIRIEYYAVKK